MSYPLTADGVHRMENGMKCACGFELVIPPICVSIEVTNKSDVLVSEGFNCESVETAVAALRRAADRLERSCG